ncbi:hypothetical protein SAMN06269185_0407 [Natronoarchaeum philippinense]|uniref:Transcriptional regulator n=1 Tax=Natronoarchaeum philippinense TaxID=558529 RepID=A0A285N7I0_NATPI|nr:transcriptional regulator [Natronoarchaeum philippinense]SNZ03936.1 hypothetical protein SAMN06269185_0407 [Natronoarchaeum philippinense]
MSRSDAPPAEIERERRRLDVVTQETRFALLQDLLGHPEGLPSLKELDYVNPSKSRSTIHGHLQTLIEVGVVETVTLPDDQRSRDLPYTFYGVTEEGRAFLDRHGLLRAEETLREIYDRIERTEEIERYEQAPRPDR